MVSNLSKGEILEYYKSYWRMPLGERRNERKSRYDEMIEQGISPTEAIMSLDGEELEARELMKEEREQEKRSGRQEKVIWKGKKSEEKPEYLETEESEKTDLKEVNPKEEYLKVRQGIVSGIQKAKAIGKGIIGIGSRRPVKEAIISGIAKTAIALKGKPKSAEDIRREKELREAQREEQHEARLERIMNREYLSPSERTHRSSSFRDIGRRDVSSQNIKAPHPIGNIAPLSPDFFGDLASSFQIGTSNPLGKRSLVSLGNVRHPVGKLKSKPNPPSTSFKIKKTVMKTMKPKKIIVEQDAAKVLGLKGWF